MSASSLINISYGARCEAKKVEEKSGGRSQQQQQATPNRPPFSPSLGASPELGKRNKTSKNRSSDSGLESPGVCNHSFVSDISYLKRPDQTMHDS